MIAAAGWCDWCSCVTTTMCPGQVPDFSNPDLERESTMQFQFVLKGMGGFGNRITNIMQDMIRGFDEREY